MVFEIGLLACQYLFYGMTNMFAYPRPQEMGKTARADHSTVVGMAMLEQYTAQNIV